MTISIFSCQCAFKSVCLGFVLLTHEVGDSPLLFKNDVSVPTYSKRSQHMSSCGWYGQDIFAGVEWARDFCR